MANGRVRSWVAKHIVGFLFVKAAFWLLIVLMQAIAIANGDVGPNGGGVFLLVLGALIAALNFTAGSILLIARRRSSSSTPK